MKKSPNIFLLKVLNFEKKNRSSIKVPMNKLSSAKGNPLVKKKKDILHLLEEVQTVAQTLCSEKASLGDQVKKIEPELSKLRAQETQLTQALQAKTELTQEVQTLQTSHADLTKDLQTTKAQLAQAKQTATTPTEPTKEMQPLQASHADLTKELQETQAQLTGQLLETQHKLDGFYPELQSLQDELQNVELQNQLLDMELLKKIEEIKDLEGRLSGYTSLVSSSSPVEKSIV